MVFGYYACFKIGAIAVPLSPRLKGPELEYVLGHSGARILITQGDLFTEVQGVRSSLGLEGVYVTDAASPIPDVQSFGELLERETEECAFPQLMADALAVVLYTSGTTARPKGVIHTHASLGRSAATMAENADIRPEDVLAMATPLCHASGFMCHLLPAIRQGATVVIIPRPAAGEVLQTMAQQRATWIFGLPVLLNNLVHCPEAASCDVSSLRVCIAGGDAVTPELQRRFRDTFGVEIVEG
jgi:long-chain acyl-CoA synthetase